MPGQMVEFAANDSTAKGYLTQPASGSGPGVIVIPNADHAFFNDSRPDACSADAARDAWERTLRFFHQHVR